MRKKRNSLIRLMVIALAVLVLSLATAERSLEYHAEATFARALNGLTKQAFDDQAGLFKGKAVALPEAPTALTKLISDECIVDPIQAYEYSAPLGFYKFLVVFSDGAICYAYPTYMAT